MNGRLDALTSVYTSTVEIQRLPYCIFKKKKSVIAANWHYTVLRNYFTTPRQIPRDGADENQNRWVDILTSINRANTLATIFLCSIGPTIQIFADEST